MARHVLEVNGTEHEVEVEPDETLALTLRHTLGLMSVRVGCGLEQCGSCVILIDDAPAFACTRTTESATGRRIRTVESLGGNHPLQRAFTAQNAGQCGYCLSGILMGATHLLENTPTPSRADIAEALEGHLCRCGAHNRILNAIATAAKQTDV